jgi:hypothetical protein
MNKRSKNKWGLWKLIVFIGMVFILVCGGVLAKNLFGENMTGPIFLFIFAMGFLGLSFLSRKNWWSIIPGGFFLSAGVAASLDNLIPESYLTGTIFLFILAATFFTLVAFSKKRWWAIMPGGLFFSLGLVVMLDNLIPHEDFAVLPISLKMGFFVWVLILGLAVTFGILWLMRKTQPTNWAKYPAVVLLVTAILAFILSSQF